MENLDFTKWKTAEGLFNNVENEIGRMYRYFINEGTVAVKFKYFKKNGGNYKLIEEQIVRPNDPLYQMKIPLALSGIKNQVLPRRN